MGEKKILGLITSAKIIRDAFGDQLEKIFGDRVKVKRYLLSDNDIDLSDCDVVLSSSKYMYGRVRNMTPSDTKIIVVRRGINLENISELFQIKPKTKVLVVSNHEYTANETIRRLQGMGIDHLIYSPYTPGDSYHPHKVAITPGADFLVPDGIETTVDIGVKLIDISTILEVLFTLELPLQNSNLLIANYTKKLIELTKYSTQLNTVLEGILSTSHDGIIAVNEDNKIMFMNETAEELINISKKASIGQKIDDVLKNKSILNMLREDKKIFNELMTYRNRSFIVNKEETIKYSIFKVKVLSIKDVTQIQKQEHEIRKKMRDKGFVTKYTFKDIIGISDKLKRTVNIAKKIADNDFTVLIKGESGTGKELFAQAIHNKSNRKNKPFIAVNFASLSDSLIESELFGYEKGAFTGAKSGGKAGLFEQAHTGTIFIDEIGDASSTSQSRLLRVLQEKEIMRVGGNSIIPVDVRVIAATNKDLPSLVESGEFRKDLYYRLKVLYFTVPPLRDRPEDIYFLVNYFLNERNDNKVISEQVYKIFKEHNWQGNVRELENIINYIITVVDDKEVEPRHLPEEFSMKADEVVTEEMDNEFLRIKEKLGNSADIKEYKEVMRVIKESKRNGLNIGRRRIAKKVSKKGLKLSPEMVRSRMEKLREFNLIKVGKTRQGSKLTEKGEELLKII